MAKRKSRKKAPANPFRRIARWIAWFVAALYTVLSLVGNWFVHHDATWLEERKSSLPKFVFEPLMYLGDRCGALTDAWGWTGHDVVYSSDEPTPEGQVLFAGRPVRLGDPAPKDVFVIDYGDFIVGWSPSLGHAAWCAYHVPAEVRFEAGARPSFAREKTVVGCPSPAVYTNTGYDRGHLVPNHAIVTRFGPDSQKKTFFMTNIAPQTPALNQGPWRVIEHMITDFWTARWGEIWVLVGPVPSSSKYSREFLQGTSIEVPEAFWMVIVAQEGEDVRVLSVLIPQAVGRRDFPVHHLTTVDNIERLTGWDLLSELPDFLERPLEAELPTRLWPIRFFDVFSMFGIW